MSRERYNRQQKGEGVNNLEKEKIPSNSTLKFHFTIAQFQWQLPRGEYTQRLVTCPRVMTAHCRHACYESCSCLAAAPRSRHRRLRTASSDPCPSFHPCRHLRRRSCFRPSCRGYSPSASHWGRHPCGSPC